MSNQEPRPAASTQDYGENPIAVRDTDQYTEEYVHAFVEKWDMLIDWERRSESEGVFFIETLAQHGARKVLDVATGTGFHSVRLLKAGYEVTSADGSPEMLYKAFENARRHDQILRTVQADWRWLNRDIHGKYDAIVCLGNSFTHLFSERDRRKALAEFYAALRHDGILILDQRNYDSILDQGFSSKHKYYYCGEDVQRRAGARRRGARPLPVQLPGRLRIPPEHVPPSQGVHPPAHVRSRVSEGRDLRGLQRDASHLGPRLLHSRGQQALRRRVPRRLG